MFPMKMIEDYKVLSYYTEPAKLEKEVKKYLAKGWVLLGSIQTHYNAQEGNVFTQVVIKVKEQ